MCAAEIPAIKTLAQNLLWWYGQAAPEHVADGVGWYDAAHTWAEGVAMEYGTCAKRVAFAAAALSPGIPWEMCMADTIAVVRSNWNAETTGYRLNKAKACAVVLDGDFEQVRGPKVRPFAELLANPDAPFVVSDRWMIRAALREEVTDKELGRWFSAA